MRKLVCLLMMALLSLTGWGQGLQPPLSLDVFPATPNASALTKFGDVPVGLSSGIPSVNVPIYSYKRNGLALNVSLDYHAGGVKVEEVASDVGIGWALNAGGVVSRTVRGLPDDVKQFGYFYNGGLGTFGHYHTMALADGNLSTTDSLWMFYKNQKDSQSDVFHYSLNGKSGKFIYGLDGSYVGIPQTKIKIERILDPLLDNHYSLKGFVLTDIDGTRYEFMKGDALYNTSMGTQTAYSYPTSWNLTKIVAPFKTDSISISYETYHLEYQLGLNESRYTWRTGFYSEQSLNAPSYSFGEYSGMANRIKRIAFPDSTNIVFDYNSIARKDITAPGGLRQVTINGGGESRGYRLYQSYGSNGAYTAGTVSPVNRLQLDSVAQFGGTKWLPPYRFGYNGSMPSRLSTAQDHWGFAYRPGRANSETLIPMIRLSADATIAGADRSPDTLYAKTGSLAWVQYPTGGRTDFTFESNRGDSKLDYLDSEEVKVSLGNITDGNEKTFTINRTVDPGAPVIFRFSMFEWCPQVLTSCKYIYSIKSLDGSTTYATAEFAYSDLNTVKQVSSNLPNGTYKLSWVFEQPVSCACDDMFGFQLSFKQYRFNKERLAGGIRLQKMVDYDGIDHNNDIIKEYSYTLEDGSPSGTVSMAPLYHYDYRAYTRAPGQTQLQASDWYYRSSSAFHPLSSVNGSPVSYSRVTVRKRGAGNTYQGKVVHEFTDYRSVGLVVCADDQGGNCLPFVHQPVKDYGIGLPLRELVYDNNDVLLKKTRNTYNHIESHDQYATSNYRSFKFAITEQSVGEEDLGYMKFFAQDFYVHTGRMEKMGETIVDYTTPNDSLMRHTAFAYDPVYFNLKSFHTLDSKGQKTERRLYYPYDYTLGGAIEKLRTDNLLSTVVSTEDWFTGTDNTTSLKDADITEFGVFHSDVVRPVKYLKLNADHLVPLATIGAFNPSVLNRNTDYFKEHILYDRFSTKGNVLQYRPKDGRSTTVLYSYNGQYPIAEIRNADYTSVENVLGAGSIQAFSNQANPNRSAVDGFLQPLKAALPNAHITSYSYRPLVGIRSRTDAKGMVTSYEYDSFGRLENIKDHNGDIVKNYKYNYADGSGLPPVVVPFRSAEVKLSKTKNNCTTGTGSSVEYIVPEGRYTSTVDQATANALAQADADANAQANANQYGNCGTPGTGTVSLNYSFPGSVQFKLRITHTATSTYTDHVLSGSGTLTGIVPGTVNLALSEVTATSTVYSFSLNGVSKSGNSTSFDSFSFTAAANLAISVPPVGGPYYNTAQTIVKTKANCPSGTGTSVSYPVAANGYSSQVSVADANQLALAGEDARAQANANALGGCTIDNTTTYYSQLTLVTKTRSNCPNGVSGVPQTMSYPVGAYTSLISVADADQQLHNAAQASVNNSGGCAVTSGTFTLDFKAPLVSNFSVHFKDAAGNTLRDLIISGNHVISNLPGGTGSITVAPWPSPPAGLTFSYSVNGGTAQATAPAVFTGISLSGTVNITVAQTRFANKALSVTKTRNNCPAGENGTSVSYVVPQSTYWSTISQADADGKAQTDVNTNSQDYANQNGTCEIATTPISVSHPVNAKVLIEVTHLTRNTTVSYTSSGTNAGTPMNVPTGLSKVKITSLESGKTYRVVLSGVVQTGSTIEYPSVNLPNYTVYLGMQEVFSNSLLTVSKTKNNCYNAHQIGEAITYTVPAGKYTSVVSQAEADQLAQDDADANAQDYANANGTCIPVYYNSARYLSKTKNDCPSGQVGTAVDYYISYGKYTSTLSQADADQKALTGEDASAQAYANTNGNCTLPPTYYSAYLSVTKTRNNCAVGYTGTSVNYVVNYGKYTSLISQADANAKAQADVDANAQNYANANGTCTPPVTYYSNALSVYKTRNNCTIDEVGSSINYYVPYAKYTSLISQADANAQAQADADANAQNYANTHGTCTPKPVTISYSVPSDKRFELYANVNGTTTLHYLSGNFTITVPRGMINLTLYNVTENDSSIFRFKLNNVLNPTISSTASYSSLDYTAGGTINLEITPYP